MKRKLYLMVVATLVTCSMAIPTFAAEKSLDAAIGANSQTASSPLTESQNTSTVKSTNGPTDTASSTQATESAPTTSSSNNSSSSSNSNTYSNSSVKKTTREGKDANFINGLNESADLSADIAGANQLTIGIRKAAAFVVSVIFNSIPVLLILRVALDLLYIGVPFTRKLLANGHQGNAQAAGGQPGGGMGGGMGMGMGGGFGGGMGGFGGGGMGGMNGGMGGAKQAPGMKIQWVSNAALNAVATETSVGPDGEAHGPFKIYIKDMITMFVMTAILIVLAATGVLTTLGTALGVLLVDGIRSVQGMM